MNCLCNIFDNNTLWLIVLACALLGFFCNCGCNCGCNTPCGGMGR